MHKKTKAFKRPCVFIPHVSLNVNLFYVFCLIHFLIHKVNFRTY